MKILFTFKLLLNDFNLIPIILKIATFFFGYSNDLDEKVGKQ